jgi:hypothetical protein
MQHEPHHHASAHDHNHHHSKGSARGDAIRIGAILIGLFLLTVLCNYLFADEVLDNWAMAHRTSEALQNLQPGA